MNNNLKTIGIALGVSIATIIGYKTLGLDQKDVIIQESGNADNGSLVKFANLPPSQPGDFTYAAAASSPAVVHIKAKSVRQVRQRLPSIFEDFFGGDLGPTQNMPQESSGSGVIISEDGYIATNNHVVEGADELEVITYDKQSYKATIIGVDPSTDIAVIKVEKTGLPTMAFGNSDIVKVGEWVLAVGNPFNLESTVTAGIISAIGRDISILKNKSLQQYQSTGVQSETPIESFIQTDAAVNPGNSGGALVNLNGELIGINTAIASPNGAYAGYAFAVPSGIVKKVTTDLIKYGNVQRGYLGVNGPVELNNKNYKELDTDLKEGIYISGIKEDGGADDAGLKPGDVIVEIDGQKASSVPKFMELIGRKRPGEKVNIKVNREGRIKDYTVTLKNFNNGETIVKKTVADKTYEKLGIELEEISSSQKERYGSKIGVKISKVFSNGLIGKETKIEDGYLITKIGNYEINSIKDVKSAFEKAREDKETGVLICGRYEGISRNYCYGLAL